MIKRMSQKLFLAMSIPVSFSLPAWAASGGDRPAWLPEFLSHASTNVAFAALLVFLFIVWRLGGFKAITSALDNRAKTIETQLNEARDLREAAAKLLAETEREQRQAQKEIDAILSKAKQDSEAMIKEARINLQNRMDRREALAEARIRQAELDAAQDVRRAAAEMALKASKAILVNKADKAYFETAFEDVEKILN